MNASRVQIAPRLLAALFALALPCAVALAGDQPGAQAVKPQFGHTEVEFEHFVQAELPKLVEGKSFDWDGHHYEVVKMHAIQQTYSTRWEPAHKNDDVPHRARAIAVIHVKIDGRLTRARIEAAARYVTFPDGWQWDKALLYLGGNDWWDFVSGKTV